MIRNYFKVAIRFFVRQKGYSLINIAGLAIGMAATMLILIYVFFELGFDRYNKDSENMYRINFHGTFGGESLDEGITPSVLAGLLLEEYPEITSAVRIFNTENRAVKYGENAWYEDKFAFADSNFFDFFTLKFIEGNPSTCLNEPHTVVMTQSTAHKYFGNDEAIGKVIKITNHFGDPGVPYDTALFRVTGVIEDMPVQSHFHFDFVASMGSIRAIAESPYLINLNMYTYIKLREGTSVDVLSGKINDFYVKNALPQLRQFLGMSEEQVLNSGARVGLDISPMSDIHLKSHGKFELEENGNIEYVRIFISVALLILLLACINFINLSTARAVKRAREVGIRKVVGSSRRQLILQFIGESFLFTVISFIISMVIVEMSMPVFEHITNYNLRGVYLDKSWFWASSAGIIILVGFLSGLYPAIVLSSYKPIEVIRALPNKNRKGYFFRNSLVTFQFIITGVILLAVILVSRQLNYVQSKQLGFDKEKILVIERTDPIKTSIKSFMDELEKLPEVEKTCLSAGMICRGAGANGFQYLQNGTPKTLLTAVLNVNYDFADVMGLKTKEGRFFSRDFKDENSIVINEMAAKEMGMTEPVGNYLYVNNQDSSEVRYPIVGVMKDFHFESLHSKIRPLIFFLTTDYFDGYISVRLKEGDHLQTVKKIKSVWGEFTEANPLVYYFFDDDFKKLYKAEDHTRRLMELFSVLAMIVAALGLFGLVSYSVTTRTREIGIRKTNGATMFNIMMLIIQDNIRPILYSIFISFPLAWFLMSKWLQNFAYRININPFWFAIVLFFLFFIGILTTLFQAFQASRINPANAVRTE